MLKSCELATRAKQCRCDCQLFVQLTRVTLWLIFCKCLHSRLKRHATFIIHATNNFIYLFVNFSTAIEISSLVVKAFCFFQLECSAAWTTGMKTWYSFICMALLTVNIVIKQLHRNADVRNRSSSLMSKPQDCDEESVSGMTCGIRRKREPILLWMTADSGIINHYVYRVQV